MAATRMFIVLATVAVAVQSAMATEFIVGDDKGWRTNFDYQAWAEGKEFRVGDKLVFKYAKGAHNVFRVDGTAFEQCVAPPASEALTTGNDIITLTTSGRKWYICGVGKHCGAGKQKLDITVLPELFSPSSSPSPPGSGDPTSSSNSASRIAASRYQVWMVSLISIFLMVLI